MIKHEIKAGNGFVEAIVMWQFADKEKKTSSKCITSDLAIAFIDNAKRKAIVDAITKYINHRSYSYSHSFTSAYSMAKVNSLAKVTMLRDLLPMQTLIGACKTIIMYQDDLVNIMPSSKSKFYNHDSKTVYGIIADCKAILEPIKKTA